MAAVILAVIAVIGATAVVTLVASVTASAAMQIDIFGAPLGAMSIRGVVAFVAVAALLTGAAVAAAIIVLVSWQRARARLRLAIAEDDRRIRAVNEVQRDILERRYRTWVTMNEEERSRTHGRDAADARDGLSASPDGSDTETPLGAAPEREPEPHPELDPGPTGERSEPAPPTDPVKESIVADALIVLDDDEADTEPVASAPASPDLPAPPTVARDR